MKAHVILHGERRLIPVIIQRRDGGSFDIGTATFEIRDRAGTVLQEELPVTGIEIATHRGVFRRRVYAIITFDYPPRTTLFIYFWMMVGDKRIGERVEVRIRG